ncbi:J domain-containing protein [soil metagenome]
MAGPHGIRISTITGAKALTPEQKRFNTLIKQIEMARETLAEWHANMPLYGQAHNARVVPLIDELVAERRALAFALDALVTRPGWSRAEVATLCELIVAAAETVLAGDPDSDPEVKGLFDKYNETAFDDEVGQAREHARQMMEAATGLDLGDDHIASDDDLLRRVHEGMAAQAERAAADEAAQPARPQRQTAAQKRRQAEAQLATQSVREVFRKLASALHPDRETDPAQREHKTALMQKANQAYAANDLLALLELQLQIEQVDASHLANASAERVRHYNKVLAEQLAELKNETEAVQLDFEMRFMLDLPGKVSPNQLGRIVDEEVRELRAALLALQRDRRTAEGDRAAAKSWLKRERKRLKDEAEDFDFFF